MIQNLQAKDTEVHGRLGKNRWSEHVEENTKEEERWTLAKNIWGGIEVAESTEEEIINIIFCFMRILKNY